MIGYDLLVLLGFFIGTILYAVLLGELIKRPNKLFHEFVFIALVAVLTMWHGSQFLAIIIKQIFGREALEIYSKFHFAAIYTIAFLPPLIVHVHASFLDHAKSLVGQSSIRYKIVPVFFYLPIFVIMYFAEYTIIDSRKRIIAENLSFVPPFIFWLIVCLWVASFLSIRIIMLSRNEKWRQFFVVEAFIMVFITALLIYFYFFGGTGNVRLDKSLKNLLQVIAILPTGALVYLMFKYPFYSIVARQRLIVTIIAGAFFTMYIIFSRYLKRWAEDNPHLNADAIAIVFVALLLILYEPVKYFLRRMAGYYALGQRYEYQTVIRQLTEKIASAPSYTELARIVRTAIHDSMQVEETAIFHLSKKVTGETAEYKIVQKFGDIKEFNLKKIIKNILQRNGIYDARKMNIFYLKSSEVPYQMYVGVTLENELVGLIAIGKKLTNEDFSYEEQELLLTLASQVAIAIENIQLMQRRIELEAKMFQADKLSSIGMLSTSIAHEVKNPLSSIKSIVQSMRDEKLKGQPHGSEIQDLEIINDEINRLANVVDQLLKFAKPETADADVVDLIKIIDNILTILRQETRSKGISIFTKFSHKPLALKSRHADLKEILFNVIINAIQSMQNGGKLLLSGCYMNCSFANEVRNPRDTNTVQVSELLRPDTMLEGYEEWRMEPLVATSIDTIDKKTCDALTEEQPINAIRISVTDTGQGIPQDRMEEIFKPFYTTKPTGTGLGLAIVKNKVEALGGRVVLKSREGLGTTFELYIPTDANGYEQNGGSIA